MKMLAFPITETSQIADARRQALALGEAGGLDETDCARGGIVITELATNLLKHGGGGELLVALCDGAGGTGLELLALDRGPGMADVGSCLADGYSTSGTRGHGLGAVVRQSQSLEIVSWPGRGTAVLARLTKARPRTEPVRPDWGAVSVAKPGEDACGDAWSAQDTAAGRTLLVVDGLGHGSEAAQAAMEAVRIFHRNSNRPVPELLDYLHAGLRSTRGAALAVARFDADRRKVIYAGIGNISGVIVADGSVRRMISHNGTAGHHARKIQAFEYPFDGGLVIMHSDGLSANWALESYPGLAAAHPTLIAGVLYRDCRRQRDDATVLVANGTAHA
jgi:anti-sigma regulatory factor (Ser/Thr protein kinase)